MQSAHPVHVPEWTPAHRRLPAHTLCLSHVRHNGRKRCLAVPEAEAAAYLAKLDRFAAELDRIVARHRKAELARPAPKGKGPKRVKPAFPPSKLHRHQPGSACLEPVESSEPGWFQCQVPVGSSTYIGKGNYVHEHRTRRGRRFLVAHIQGDRWCPATIAAAAARAAEDEATPTCDICGQPEDQDPTNGREYNWNGETGNHQSCEAREAA